MTATLARMDVPGFVAARPLCRSKCLEHPLEQMAHLRTGDRGDAVEPFFVAARAAEREQVQRCVFQPASGALQRAQPCDEYLVARAA
ncbi:MAG: hypothetical protein NTW37_15835 [Proteobacteria bacterium]|nr:hypothetical protein [Pseudomonadota bacterium]